jgi:CheY-like chemotaxis protein
VHHSGGNETILLVEDDAAVREVLIGGLEQEGYRVIAAANGREAFDVFLTHRAEIELIVTDLIMPEIGGIALGEQLREAGAKLPVVYMSGYHQDLEKYSTEQLPLARGFLLKPFNPQTLAAAIREAFANVARAATSRSGG